MVQTGNAIDDLVTVRRAVDSVIEGDIEPLLNLLPDNVAFEVVPGDEGDVARDWGQQAVAEYFTAFSGFAAFWQIDWTGEGDQVIAWGKESFTIQGTEIEGGCEFALIFELSEGRITRLTVVEDLRVWATHSSSPAPLPTASFPPRISSNRGSAVPAAPPRIGAERRPPAH
jgi:hypothetical protein